MSLKSRDRRQMSIIDHSLVKYLILYIISICFLRLAPAAFASRSLSITANKSTLTADEDLTLTASHSGFTGGETIYIKGAFYKEGSTNYFGYTKKDTDWIKNSATTADQRSIIIGSWDNTATVKPDFNDTGFIGNGSYLLKLGYYYITGGGNISSVQWSTNNVSTSLTQPTPTPTLTPTPTPTATPVPTSTPTQTPTPTPTATPKPTTAPSSSPTAKPSIILADSDNKNSISDNENLSEIDLAINDAMSSAPTNISEVLGTNDDKISKPSLPLILIITGTLLSLAGGVLLAYQEIKNRQQ